MAAQPPRRRGRNNPPPKNAELYGFEEPNPIFSNVVIKTDGVNFYCMTQHLARHSKYFESMFFRGFEETGRHEVTLENVPAMTFDLFLKLTNGIGVVTDESVEGLLELGDYISAIVPTRRAEEFLIRDSQKTTKEKFSLANEYDLEGLIVHICTSITTTDELNQLVPATEIDSLHLMARAYILKKMYALVGMGENEAERRNQRERDQLERVIVLPPRLMDQQLRDENHNLRNRNEQLQRLNEFLQQQNDRLFRYNQNNQAELFQDFPVPAFPQPHLNHPDPFAMNRNGGIAGNADQPERVHLHQFNYDRFVMQPLPAAWIPPPMNPAVGPMQDNRNGMMHHFWPEQNQNQWAAPVGWHAMAEDIRAGVNPQPPRADPVAERNRRFRDWRPRRQE